MNYYGMEYVKVLEIEWLPQGRGSVREVRFFSVSASCFLLLRQQYGSEENEYIITQ
jgi:hypothetical protein